MPAGGRPEEGDARQDHGDVARKEDEKRRRLAARNDEGLWRLTEYMDMLEADVSRYTDAQLAEYKRELGRRSRELFGGGA
jgi:hypothetical protein